MDNLIRPTFFPGGVDIMSRKAGLWGIGLICRLSMSDLDTVSNPDRNPLFLSISFVFSLFLLLFVI